MSSLSFVSSTSASTGLVSPAALAGRIEQASPARTRRDDHADPVESPGANARERDRVELSAQARLGTTQVTQESSTIDASPIRTELVGSIKAQIVAGTYDTPEKYLSALSKAVARIDPNS